MAQKHTPDCLPNTIYMLIFLLYYIWKIIKEVKEYNNVKLNEIERIEFITKKREKYIYIYSLLFMFLINRGKKYKFLSLDEGRKTVKLSISKQMSKME